MSEVFISTYGRLFNRGEAEVVIVYCFIRDIRRKVLRLESLNFIRV